MPPPPCLPRQAQASPAPGSSSLCPGGPGRTAQGSVVTGEGAQGSRGRNGGGRGDPERGLPGPRSQSDVGQTWPRDRSGARPLSQLLAVSEEIKLAIYRESENNGHRIEVRALGRQGSRPDGQVCERDTLPPGVLPPSRGGTGGGTCIKGGRCGVRSSPDARCRR